MNGLFVIFGLSKLSKKIKEKKTKKKCLESVSCHLEKKKKNPGRDDTRKGDSVDKEGSEEEEPSYLGPAADEALPGVLPGGQVLGELALEVAAGGGLVLGAGDAQNVMKWILGKKSSIFFENFLCPKNSHFFN